MDELAKSGIGIMFQLGAVGVIAVAFAAVNYFLVRRILTEASADKKMLIETLTTTVSDNTAAMNNVAEALGRMSGEDVPRIKTNPNRILNRAG